MRNLESDSEFLTIYYLVPCFSSYALLFFQKNTPTVLPRPELIPFSTPERTRSVSYLLYKLSLARSRCFVATSAISTCSRGFARFWQDNFMRFVLMGRSGASGTMAISRTSCQPDVMPLFSRLMCVKMFISSAVHSKTGKNSLDDLKLTKDGVIL